MLIHHLPCAALLLAAVFTHAIVEAETSGTAAAQHSGGRRCRFCWSPGSGRGLRDQDQQRAQPDAGAPRQGASPRAGGRPTRRAICTSCIRSPRASPPPRSASRRRRACSSVNDLVLSFFPDLAPEKPARADEEHAHPRPAAHVHRASERHEPGDRRPAGRRLDQGVPGDRRWRTSRARTSSTTPPQLHARRRSCRRSAGRRWRSTCGRACSSRSASQPPMWGMSPEGVNLGDGGLTLAHGRPGQVRPALPAEGRVERQALLSEQWVEDATSLQTATGGNPDSNWDAGYGYQFWRNKVTGYPRRRRLRPVQLRAAEVRRGAGHHQRHRRHGRRDGRGLGAPVACAARARRCPTTPRAHGRAEEQARLPGAARASRRAQLRRWPRTCPAQVHVRRRTSSASRSASVDFSGADPAHHLSRMPTASTSSRAASGAGSAARTGFQKRISNVFDNDHQGIAASCAWADDHTFVAKLCFHETPYTLTQPLQLRARQAPDRHRAQPALGRNQTPAARRQALGGSTRGAGPLVVAS